MGTLCVAVDCIVCAVEDNGIEESRPVNEPSALCTESSSTEKPQDTDCAPSNFNAGSAETVIDSSETNDAHVTDINPELETDCQPLVAPPTATVDPSEQHASTEVPLSAGSMQPNFSEVLNKKKRAVGTKKRSRKQNTKADITPTEVSEGTWQVSSSEDNSKKNVVLIRRQHPFGIPEAACPVQEAACSQSPVSCEMTCTEKRHVPCKADEGDTIRERIASVEHEHIEGTENTAAIDAACIETDITGDTSAAKNVNSLPSADGRDIAESQSAGVRPKRRRNMAANREACRKSQRCISRRREADERVVMTPLSTSTAEAKTAGSDEDAATVDDESASCLVSARPDVSQEQTTSLPTVTCVTDETEPAAAVSGSVINKTEVGIGSCDQAVLNSGNITTASVDSISQPAASAAPADNSDTAAERTSKSRTSGSADRVSVIDSSQDQSPPNSASHVRSSACPDDIRPTIPIGVVQQDVKIEPPQDNKDSCLAVKVENVKRDSDSINGSYPSTDFNSSNLQPSDASLLNTCLSGTFLETLVSPEEQLSRNLLVRRRAADGVKKEDDNGRTSSDTAVIDTGVSCEGETGEICKTILAEVVADVVKVTSEISPSKENIVSSLTESSGHGSRRGTASQNESDSASGEIPLKKRRGRRVFADCQPNDAVVPSRQTAEDRGDTVSARSSSSRRKITSSSSRRHSPRGKKYVGAHTSVVGKSLAEYIGLSLISVGGICVFL